MAAAFDINALRARFVEQGVFIRPLGRVICLAPAYTIGAEAVGKLTEAIRYALGALGALGFKGARRSLPPATTRACSR